MSEGTERQDGLAVVGVFLGLVALLGAVFSVGLAVRANDENGGTGVAASGAQVEVVLTEFAVTPAELSAPAGATLLVKNEGSRRGSTACSATCPATTPPA